MNSGIRRVVAAVLFAGSALCFPLLAEENSGNVLTGLGSSSISGYVNMPMQWQTRASGRDAAVGVVAVRPAAQEGKLIGRSPRSGAFKFFRRGDISKPLTVYFVVDGTAIAGVDYVASSNGKPFPLVSALPPPSWTGTSSTWTYYGGVSFSWGISLSSVITSTGSGGIVGPPISITNLPPPAVIRVVDWMVIPAGRRTVTLTIDPIDDRRREIAESVIISISSDGSPYPSRASVQIIDNDR